MKKTGVLFVCTGNICRSPTAEAVLRHHLRPAGLEGRVVVDSAGTHGYHAGDPPDPRAVAAAGNRGIAMADLRARRFAAPDFEAFDLVLAMDRGHHDILYKAKPENCRARLSLFTAFCPGAGVAEVPDPYYGRAEDFEYVLGLIEQGVEGIIKHLKQECA